MSTIKQVYDLTNQLVQLVEQEPAQGQRELTIETITALLKEREGLLVDIKAPVSDEENQMAQQIISWNDLISTQFLMIKNHVQRDIAQLRKTKSLTTKYINPYKNISSDGLYYDKRK